MECLLESLREKKKKKQLLSDFLPDAYWDAQLLNQLTTTAPVFMVATGFVMKGVHYQSRVQCQKDLGDRRLIDIYLELRNQVNLPARLSATDAILKHGDTISCPLGQPC